MGFGLQSLGFRVWGVELRVWGLGARHLFAGSFSRHLSTNDFAASEIVTAGAQSKSPFCDIRV